MSSLPENPKVKAAMNTLLKMFDEGNLEKVAHAIFKGSGNLPSDKWSFMNRLLMYLSDTEDARGFQQWKQVERCVMKGSKAFYILGPKFIKVDKKDSVTDEKVEILSGFIPIPVFRFEDTDGAPLVSDHFMLDLPCEFDGIIKELGLKVRPVRFCGSSYGSYNLIKKEIRLASPDIEIFLHELSHAVDDRLTGLRPGQKVDQEVTAEFSAAVIGYLMGYKIPFGNIKEYIEHYSFKELINCLVRIEKIVSFVIERTSTGEGQKPLPCAIVGVTA